MLCTGALSAPFAFLGSAWDAKLKSVYTDITHEIAFTPQSFEEMLFCHRLKLT